MDQKNNTSKLFTAKAEVKEQAENMTPASKADFTDTKSHVGSTTDRSDIYLVLAGDTLSKIAELCYGDRDAAKLLFDANRDQLLTPEDLTPGQMLKIPNTL